MAFGSNPDARFLLYDPLSASIRQELEKFVGMVFAVPDAFIRNEGLVDPCNWVGMWTWLLCLFHLFQDAVEKLEEDLLYRFSVRGYTGKQFDLTIDF
jgi:hypothetical protein